MGAGLGRDTEPLGEATNALFSGMSTCVLRHTSWREGDLSLVPTYPTPLAGHLGGVCPPHSVSAALGFCNAEGSQPRGRVRAAI